MFGIICLNCKFTASLLFQCMDVILENSQSVGLFLNLVCGHGMSGPICVLVSHLVLY